MAQFKVGIIGCGRPRRESGATGFGMAHAHAAGYETCPDTEIVAVADIKRENGGAFAEEHGVPGVYGDYTEMLEKENLDIVSICLWIALQMERMFFFLGKFLLNVIGDGANATLGGGTAE